ncbi:MAG: hypothetical protein OXF52_06200, partial [Candidatus Dadabacteria bacterium]|nr:hypothetical protein [Candidatus Dadabacteria bacterium]
LYFVSDEKLHRKSLPMCGEVEKVFVRLLFSFKGDVVKTHSVPDIESLSIIGDIEIPFNPVKFK